MKIHEILERVNSFAPFELAETWDNSGLMIRDPEAEVTRLGLSLDPLPGAVEEARVKGCQCLLSHHPLFFKPIKILDTALNTGHVAWLAARAGMSIISAHTNWDKAESGVNKILAQKIGLTDIVPLDHSGIGSVGNLLSPAPVIEFLEKIKRAWSLTRIDYYGKAERSILRVALCGGAGGDFWSNALSAKADIYITADIKYHELLDCAAAGLSVAAVDHGEMEGATMADLAERMAAPGKLDVILLDYRGLGSPIRL
ncbi:GTP cyclohydrolase 1 type 2 [Synergistales bacterium]|nr:GTP cyclohydrolase 1 type 2 [Synergistales bacterium]